MDKVIEKKKWSPKKWGLVIGAILLVGASIQLAFSSKEKKFRIEKSKLSYATVVFDDFQDMISFQGTVEPKQTIQLDAKEGGVVEEIFVEDGAMVVKGQVLMRLSNTTLKLDFMNRETQIIEQINNLRSTRISLDQNKRQVQEQLIDLTYNLKEQTRQYKLDSTLFEDGIISETEYLASEASYVYLVEKQDLLNDRLQTDEAYRLSQLNRIDASVEMMERNLDAIRLNLENLIVRAPINGLLNSFDHEMGQTKSRGENMGRIDVLSDYQISAFVDQYYLNRMQEGQLAKALFGGANYPMQVKKIFPTVVNGQFEVHLMFADSVLPRNIRRGQNVQVRLELSATKKVKLVPRGGFSQSNGGQHVFIVQNGDAVKRKVVFGAQNPDFIEVKEGLEIGDEIIVSSYTSFGDAEKIILTEK